jgi:hypothetical protein
MTIKTTTQTLPLFKKILNESTNISNHVYLIFLKALHKLHFSKESASHGSLNGRFVGTSQVRDGGLANVEVSLFVSRAVEID